MDIYRDQISKNVYEQKKLLDSYTKEYRLLYGSDDEDHLICCRNNGKDYYYRVTRAKGKYIRKSIGRDIDTIRVLARKEYLRIAMDTLSSNIGVLDSALEELEDIGFDSLVEKMSMAYRKLPEECFFSKETGHVDKLSGESGDRFRRHRKWADEPYEQSDYMPERRRFMTSGGFRVRSKSEQHIAEQLLSYGVPFRYENVIRIDGVSYSADFTFRDRTGELFYWEHAGMMDVPKYVDGYHRKMNVFAGAGIVPWKNLIITYDIDGVINVPMIRSIIEHDVIPRL